jgi:GDPmannose 4,6-dehydratase
MAKTALITGITGQDGSYLAELLLAKGYQVHGTKRRSSSFNTDRIDHLYQDPHSPASRFHLHYADLSDGGALLRLVAQVAPDEIYNLGAMSHVAVSFEQPEYTADIDGIGTLRILEAVRTLGMAKRTRFYQASTSELFGMVHEVPQRESTPFHPRSPYACAKLFAYWITVNYREAYSFYACNGILFNHESPRRGETFVTRKISQAIARISLGVDERLYLGNLDALRDWGHARDYVEMQWLMLQQERAEDFVIATGRQETVRRFVELCCNVVGIQIRWEGTGLAERGIDAVNGRIIVQVDRRYFRPAEVETLLGDSTRAQERIGWKAATTLEQLVDEMMAHDLALARREKIQREAGFRVNARRE